MKTEAHVLMMIESSRESGRQLISGVADYARHFGPWHFHWQPQGLKADAGFIQEMQYNGVLLRDVADVQPFLDAGIPVVGFVYAGQYVDSIGWVNTDDHEVSSVIADHFLQRGFRHFAFCGYADLPWSVARGEGYAQCLAEAGYNVETYWTHPAEDGELDEEMINWLSALPRQVALMVANDDLGYKVIELCRKIDRRVPDDIAIVGVDDDPVICGISNPPLSSVGMNQHKSGYEAAALLDQMMRGNIPENRIITAGIRELVVRQSSDIVAVEDEAVARAVRFIQRNANRALSVDEVALSSGLHRRGLERRFKEYLARSIKEYCREVRAEYLAKVLRESRMSLEEIAERSGFSEACNLTRFFTSVRGESPSAYRKRIFVR